MIKKLNVVLIISDGLRPKDLSLYGRKEEYDSNLKKIAEESVVFEKNFTASNASDSSVTAMFSGQLPRTNGFIHQHPFMRDEEIEKLKKNKFWLPLYLQRIGYQTISATPLHLWFKKGFDFYMSKEQKGQNKFLNNSFVKKILLALPSWAYSLGKKISKKRASPQFYPSNEVVDLAIEKIKESEKENKPFFVFMHLVDTHYPYPIAEMKKFQGGKDLNKLLKEVEFHSQREYLKKRFFDIQAHSIKDIENRRDYSIKFVDKQIYRLYEFIKKEKILEDTIFIITSDHGDSFGEHSIYLCRGGLYDPTIQTPLIIKFPNSKKEIINELTMNIDFAPTILDLIGEKKQNIDGKSLIPLIKSGKKLRDSITITDSYCNDRFCERTKTKKTIITNSGGKCYLCGGEHHKQKKEVYDLENDSDELNDLSKK
ncbi:sulfatase [Candidatus Pacearchaeota archaeon]|nr:sulfatase [Candidatus Pacearchaeota archaeon]